MMEVTQNMELKELSTGEKELLQSIVSDLDHEVDDKKATMKKSNESVDKEICNGLDADDPDNDIEPSTLLNSIDKISDIVPSKERDAGTDLDALLDKITSIVDYNPKASADEVIKQSSLKVKTVVEDIDINDDIETPKVYTEPEIIDGKDANKVRAHNKSVEKVKDALPVATLKKTGESSESAQNKQKIYKTDIWEAVSTDADSEGLDEKKAENDIKAADMVDPDATNTNLNNSNDEVFMDALENISSSDEFDALAENNKKTQKESMEKESKYGQEDITSDDSIDKVDPSMEKTRVEVSIIDLDTSEECSAEKQNPEETTATNKQIKVNEIEENDKIEDIALQEMNDKVIDKVLVKAAESSESYSKETIPKEKEEGNEEESDVLAGANDNILEKALKDSNETLNKELLHSDDLSNPDDQELAKKDADSDDEVIFFEPIKKSAKTTTEDQGEECNVIKPSSDTDKKEEEVVLLSEDEDDLPPTKPEEAPSKNLDFAASEATANGCIGVDWSADNSDNACDQFEELEAQEKPKGNTIENDNSNSSNLLQPTQKIRDESVPVAVADAERGAEPETDQNAELEDNNVEMVAEEPEDGQAVTPPAVKRIRLSTDPKTEISNTSSCTNTINTTTATTSSTTNDEKAPQTIGKRSHSLLSKSSPSQKEETPSKKLKADDSDSNSSNDGMLQIDLDAHEHTQSESEAPVADVKPADPVAELKMPVELNPKPELKCDVKPVRLEFVKSFRKSFDKMTRLDLEELVLQKVVESMLVKSEFAEIQRQVDNHEVTLANYRRKIAEVSKQYLDLETVHKRVLKDLEMKNAHFTAPVRITRAVGLQVGMALMKKPSEESRNHHTAGSMPVPSQAVAQTSPSPVTPTPPKASTSPLRSTVRPGRPISRPQQKPEQQQNLQQQQQAQLARSSLPYTKASGSSNTSPVRRGCMQKVTPQRPVNNHASQSHSNQSMQQQRMHASQTSQIQRSPMFASKHTSIGPLPTATVSAGAALAMRHRGPTAKPSSYSSMTHKVQQQQQQQPLPVRIGRSPGKQHQSAVSVNTKQRLVPIGGGTVSVPMLNAQESGAVAAGYGQPSLAPARPKEKAVIDLTDEDDAAAAAAAAVVAAAEASARLRPPSVTVKRNMQSTPVSGARPVAGSVVRVSPLNMPRANAVSRQIISNNGSVQRGSIGSNVAGQIRSENTPPSGSRSRLSHPAPLPLAPAQTFHPDWKLPPSRPIIRISLHETGIVISWTLEDTGSRFAECVTYQIYAYQETINEPSTDSWRHVGDVKAMLLPMAVTLNQFQENQRYFFAVRGVDAHERYGVFSLPKTW